MSKMNDELGAVKESLHKKQYNCMHCDKDTYARDIILTPVKEESLSQIIRE